MNNFQKSNPIFRSFQRGVCFGLGFSVVAIASAMTLNISAKQDGGGVMGTLSASEFNQIIQVLQGITVQNGNVGIGIAPTKKLHVSGKIQATGFARGSNLTSCAAGTFALGFNAGGNLVCSQPK